MHRFFSLLILASSLHGAELPLLGPAHVGVVLDDLDRARSFYSGVLGLDEAYASKSRNGKAYSRL